MLRAATAGARQVSVGIVGAGFAGLRCADILLRHGCDVTIFEARNRLGGRVAQTHQLGHLVDLGPNWIHGTASNPILDIARQTGTQTNEVLGSGAAYGADGTLLSHEDMSRYMELLWGENGLVPAAFSHSRRNGDSIDPQTSLYDFFEEKSKSLFLDEPTHVADRKREELLQCSFMYSFYIGSPMTRQSMKFFWLEDCIAGENPFVAGTYHKILDAVSSTARDRAEIRLNTEVISCTSNNWKTGHAGSHFDTASIETSDGAVFSFNEVVCTIPLGCLKKSKSFFKPDLPARLSEAIDNINYGQLDKVYVTFVSAFWDAPTTQNQPASQATQSSPNPDVSKHFAGFVHFLEPKYAPSTNPECWMQESLNLAALDPECAHPTLLFYTQGPTSQHIADLVTQAKTDDERDSRLIEFFEPYFSRLPNYDSSNPSCKPRAVLATAWANDKFAGYGSYCNCQTGLKEADKDIETMRYGMPDRHIWLAGEHTAPFESIATSTGAYLSGEGVANRIVDAYGLEECPV